MRSNPNVPAAGEFRVLRWSEAENEFEAHTGADGFFENVVKIKPPLVLTRENADHPVATLDRILDDGTSRGVTRYRNEETDGDSN